MQDLIPFIQRHSGLFVIFAVIILTLIIIEIIRLRNSVNKITPTEAILLINRERAVVIDLRSETAFKAGHIVDAMSLPYANLEKKIKTKTFKTYRKRPLLLISESENQITRAAAELTTAGFNVRSIKGGIHSWRQADLPLVKG